MLFYKRSFVTALAVRAFLIMAIIVVFSGNVAVFFSEIRCNKKMKTLGALLLILAGLFAIIASATYTGKNDLPPSASYGLGYIFAWIFSGLSLLAGGFAFMSASKM